MARERKSLTTLSPHLARKRVDEEPVKAQAKAEPKEAKTDDRVQVIVRMTAAERKALRQIALDQDTTAQALAEAAIRDVLQRYGH